MRNQLVPLFFMLTALAVNAYADYGPTTMDNPPRPIDVTPNTNKNPGLPQELFLEGNKTKPGVVVLPSGLQYKVITPGSGPSPVETDTVTVHYDGRLVDGTVFDSSYKRGEPATFPVNGVIPGWTEALKLMQPGSVWELYIPANLAYGEAGSPPQIGPNQVLIFKVNLIKVNGRS